ncbi:glycoside hydrolase family 105 protein [Serpula lacrymans var. lacrymans S7.9]|uniref:Glycoside hydrolase family 105 protein n=1 Tax=Serpula lacrymans var. lacrymans (strain S7.9) TaxID=578457 RepID=F8NPU7_SERL9|nr:glycoside hydrolase family 105 protein [Serpula lacrymans var. lacrymans S7.9]EGO27253.1 glycoside hydrolase family 105 protein [Serpula lacrymans var. lacrymans S7.9]
MVELGFNDDTVTNVRMNLLASANTSWELGTAAEALTELSWPSLAVFQSSAFPPITNESHRPSDVIDIATNQQLDYLLNHAPRSPSGAISQRTDEVQLWSDFVYMGPPFIAYYGALQGGDKGAALLQTAYDQCRLYRNELRDANGLWRHVALGSWQDRTHWGTGNGWAAAGMLRVLETIQKSTHASNFIEQQANLTSWIQEIVKTAWNYQQEDGALLNTLDDSSSFTDTSATAILAAVTYRMAVVRNDTTDIHDASMALRAIANNMDANGWLLNTVNPYTFNSPTDAGNHSPEGQAFVLLLHSAWRDYVDYFTQDDN